MLASTARQYFSRYGLISFPLHPYPLLFLQIKIPDLAILAGYPLVLTAGIGKTDRDPLSERYLQSLNACILLSPTGANV
jgi:hypothetical protein